VQIKVGEGKYEKVPWANFSQEDLKRLPRSRKLEPLVEPFIEITQEEKTKKTELTSKTTRLERPAAQSLIGASFHPAWGVCSAAAVWRPISTPGMKVSIFRARPAALVCGISAVLPLAGPIIFLSCRPDSAGRRNLETSAAAAAATARQTRSTDGCRWGGAPGGVKARARDPRMR